MNADATAHEIESESKNDGVCAGWPVGNGHEQHLAQTLEYVNDVIRRVQTLYGYCEGRGEALNDEQAEAALEESEALRDQLARAGETVEAAAEASPALSEVSEAEIGDCTEYYAEVRTVNETLRAAWEQLNDAVGAAEAMAAPSDWGEATDADAFTDTVAEARSQLWRAQAQTEQLLLDRFDYEEEDFTRPADDLSWD